jgi:hypothetical protein
MKSREELRLASGFGRFGFFRGSPAVVLLLALVSLVAGVPARAADPPEKSRNHFDSDAPFREPAFFDFVVLGAPGPASWRVVTEFNPPSAPNGVSQINLRRPADSIAAAIRRNVVIRDGSVSVGIKKLAGQAGLVLRFADEKNYLALLVDPIGGDARLIRAEKGVSHEVARGRISGDREWGFLVVTLAGPKLSATFDGAPVLEATVPAVAGRVGLATAGPGLMTFDELVIDPNAAKPEAK